MIAIHIGREQITVSNSAKSLNETPTLSTTTKMQVIYADLQVQSNQIRATFDGSTAPEASTTGILLNPNSSYRIWGLHNIENFQMIRESSDATVVVNYWGRN